MAQYPPPQDQQYIQQPGAPQQQQQFGAPAGAPAPAHGAQPGHEQGLGPQLNAFVSEVTQFKVHPETPGAQAWTNGFWNFVSPIEDCAWAYFCPCIIFGRTHARLQDPTLANYDHVNGACVGWLVSSYFGLHCILTGLERSKIRERYNLEGSPAMDFLCSCCCAWCTLVQHEKEVKERTQQNVPLNQGYQKTEGGMAYPPTQ
jgi:Cys-rich protein (TIGR01571 family)